METKMIAVAQCLTEKGAIRAAKKHANAVVVHEPEARGCNERWIVLIPG